MKKRELRPTDFQQRFVHEYRIDLDPRAAYVRAGGSAVAAESASYKTLRHPWVVAELAKAARRSLRKLELEADAVLLEVMRVAYADPAGMLDASGKILPLNQMPERLRRAIASMDVTVRRTADGGEETTVRVKFWDKIKALEILCRQLSLARGTEAGDSLNGRPLVIELASLTQEGTNAAVSHAALPANRGTPEGSG